MKEQLSNFIKKETTSNQEANSIAKTIVISIGLIILLALLYMFALNNTKVIISRGRLPMDTSLYGNYKLIINIHDLITHIFPILMIISIISFLILGLLQLFMSKKNKLTTRIIRLIKLMLIAVFTPPIIILAFNFVFTMATGVEFTSCWCGDNYIEIENKNG